MHDTTMWESSADAWFATVEKDQNRVLLLDPIMLRLCGDLQGLRCLDVGCGEGRFMRMLTERGAQVIGIDPISRFAEAAKAIVGSGDALPFANSAFDLVVSYLSHCDIENSAQALSEWSRVLVPGGRLIIADIHPMCGIPHWIRDSEGNKLHRAVDRYFEARGDIAEWNGIRVINYHRPMSATITTLISNGLMLDHFEEPYPDDATIKAMPKLADHRRVPNFWVTVWRKPMS